MRWLKMQVVVLAFVCANSARADSWALPEKQEYVSDDKMIRLTVLPRDLGSQLAYFEDKVREREPAGQRVGSANRKARAVLERRSGGRRVTVWKQSLVNDVAPVSAIVSNDARYVVTFDNWHSVGFGDDVVVIYGKDGQLVRAFGLAQFLPEAYIRALPRSVSSMEWGGDHRFAPDGLRLLLAVVIPDDDPKLPTAQRATIEIAVELSTGAISRPSGAAWERALTNANLAVARREADAVSRRSGIESESRRYPAPRQLGDDVSQTSVADQVADELEKMADELEREADRLENAANRDAHKRKSKIKPKR